MCHNDDDGVRVPSSLNRKGATMTAKDRKAAKTLAVAYQAYCEHASKGDFSTCWSEMLDKAQKETGIYLTDVIYYKGE